MNEKLKPCPFCGRMPHLYGRRRRDYVDGEWAENEAEEYWVKPFCSITCILGNAHARAYGAVDGIKYETPEAAMKAWNSRAEMEGENNDSD